MRTRMTKTNTGRGATNRKECALRINKAGLNADGTQRYVIAFRLTPDGARKITTGEYVVPELDNENNRIYFSPAESDEGYKLTTSTKGGSFKVITATINDAESWRSIVGNYDLKKDSRENLYYIDIIKTPEI